MLIKLHNHTEYKRTKIGMHPKSVFTQNKTAIKTYLPLMYYKESTSNRTKSIILDK